MQNIVPVDFVDVSKMAAALVLRHASHFADDTRRQAYPGSPHHDTETIVLRGPKGGATPENWFQDVEHEDYPLLSDWPTARHCIAAIKVSRETQTGKPCDFGKILVVSLKPMGIVDWHVDEGDYAAAHDRFHVCLVPSYASFLHSGPESVSLNVGHLTYFNNRVPHCATNFGPVPRVHLILDIRKPVLQ